MIKSIRSKTTFSKSILLPGLTVLLLLSLLCAIIPDTTQKVPVTYFFDGRTGNDIQYLGKDEIIADVLREYDRFLSIVADEKNAMIFLEKKR